MFALQTNYKMIIYRREPQITQMVRIYTDFKGLRHVSGHVSVILSNAKNLPNTLGDASLRSA